MPTLEAKKAVGRILQSGYRHHAYEHEQEHMRELLLGEITFDITHPGVKVLRLYADVLGPDNLRAMKNCLICFLTSFCRAAIGYGLDSETSFAYSDYYIGQVEACASQKDLEQLLVEVVLCYRELVQDQSYGEYAPPIARAVRYIRQHLYDAFTVADLAAHVGFSPQYFSARFRKETGIPPSAFLEDCRLEEARRMLLEGHGKVLEIAEALGFCSPSYFTQRFYKKYGELPSQIAMN